jgi:hypothetical protein
MALGGARRLLLDEAAGSMHMVIAYRQHSFTISRGWRVTGAGDWISPC